jgi:integrase
VFHSQTGGPLVRSTLRRAWLKATAAAGIPGFTLRNLRHTGGSIVNALGADDNTLKEWMGHSVVGITRDLYVKSYDDAQDAIARKMELMFRRREADLD